MSSAGGQQGKAAGRRSGAQALLLPRVGDVLFVAVMLLVVMLGPRLLNVDGDLGRHLTVGQLILETGHIPTTDVFSHTRSGETLTPHEWMSEILFAIAERVLGLDGVVLLCALVLALTFWLTYRAAAKRSRLVLGALALTLLAASASSLHWLPRPHLFTLLLAVAWTEGLEGIVRGEHIAWWRLPLIMLAWANLHGAFVFGFVIWLAYAVDWAWCTWRTPPGQPHPTHGKQLAVVVGLSLVATLVNPVGPRLWSTSIGYVGNAYLVGHTAEYLSPNFHDVSTWPFLLMILVSPWIMAGAERPLRPRSLLLLLGWTGLGLYSVRHVALYAVIAAPILSEALAGGLCGSTAGEAWRKREAKLAELEASFRGGVWPVASVLAVAALMAFGVRLTPLPGGDSFSARVFPVQAMDRMDGHPPGERVFNYFPWGGYLLYRAWPEVTVFIDGQTDFYGEALTREYERVIMLSEGWEQVLARYDVDWVIMPTDSRLVGALRQAVDWIEAYGDDTAVILRRVR